jgi:hypothetical protein
MHGNALRSAVKLDPAWVFVLLRWKTTDRRPRDAGSQEGCDVRDCDSHLRTCLATKFLKFYSAILYDCHDNIIVLINFKNIMVLKTLFGYSVVLPPFCFSCRWIVQN